MGDALVKIFLDMDEVLSNFRGAACRLHRKTPAEMTEWCGAEYWNTPEFWEPMNRLGADFWTALEPFPWTFDLVALAERVAGPDNWFILTSPAEHPGSYAGKAAWVTSVLGVRPYDKLIPWSKKWMLAKSDRVLIDDLDHQVNAWTAAGGRAILFPTLYNRRREFAIRPMDVVSRDVAALGALCIEPWPTIPERPKVG
jgi:hypothetical protein